MTRTAPRCTIFAGLTDWSERRACRPRADAPNTRDRVPHEEARLRILGDRDLRIRRDVDLRVPGHQVPDATAVFYPRPCMNDCTRVDPDSGLSRHVEREHDAGVASDVPESVEWVRQISWLTIAVVGLWVDIELHCPDCLMPFKKSSDHPVHAIHNAAV